ncbi:hypothetical protein INS49_010182 [Diaporthe citri]|uniref:uncharacterized protein n=1 Tax=Diaporthe citri TaxID=83186 RepID=UPI001C7E68EE|nr:uncharacterized protein INS49_010182 [Diaporthe citri]KAG6361953.1 hypothetical protein INS49_010182 [Diaporthe citri]
MSSVKSEVVVSAARCLQSVLALAQNEPSLDQPSITANCTTTCEQLGIGLPTAFHPGTNDPDFAVWDAKAQEVQPACRVEPSDAAEVARVLEIAVENQCQVAIKSGGHSTNRDAPNSVGGVTIDLVRINHVRLLDDHIQADFGPGLILRDAYAALEPFNLTNFGGRTADVGLAGYTIGGGLTALGPKFGLALDNVFEYELVLPNSTIVNEYRLTTALSDDLDTAFHNRYFYTQSQDSFSWNFFQEYNQPVLNPTVFDSLNRMPPLSDQVRVDYASVLSLDEVSPHGLRRFYATVTFHPSRELHRKIIDLFTEEVQGIKSTANLTASVVVQPLHVNSIKTMKERGGNALGIESDGPLLSESLMSTIRDDYGSHANQPTHQLLVGLLYV